MQVTVLKPEAYTGIDYQKECRISICILNIIFRFTPHMPILCYMKEKGCRLMKSYYPITVQQIQERVEEECDHLDYEGSRLYDEYPDKYMFYHLCSKIKESIEPEMTGQSAPGGFLDELVQVMLCQEISRRRCRRKRCRSCFGGHGRW